MRKKRTALDELKVKYEKQSIDDLIKKAHELRSASNEARKCFIELLYFLERTKRFRQFKGYENTTFETFIRYEFYPLTLGTYEQQRRAFIANEKESLIYGPGVVTKVRAKCGPTKVDQVFAKLKPGMPPEKIDRIIADHSKPEKPKRPKIEMPTEVERQLRDELQDRDTRIEELESQIEKLKATVEREKSAKAEIQKKYEDLLELYTMATGPALKKAFEGMAATV